MLYFHSYLAICKATEQRKGEMESWKSVWTYVFYSDQDWTSPVAETFAELLIWLPAAEERVCCQYKKTQECDCLYKVKNIQKM